MTLLKTGTFKFWRLKETRNVLLEMAFDKKLIKNVDDLGENLKDAKASLNKALVETELYKKFLKFVLEENIAEKPAKAQALKLTLEFYKGQV